MQKLKEVSKMKKLAFLLLGVSVLCLSCSKREPQEGNVAPVITKFISSSDKASVRMDGATTIIRTKCITFEVDAYDADKDTLSYTWTADKANAQGDIIDGKGGKIIPINEKKVEWHLPDDATEGNYYKISVQVVDIGKNGAPKGTSASTSKLIRVVEEDAIPNISDIKVDTVMKCGPMGCNDYPVLKFNITEPDLEDAIVEYEISYTPPYGTEGKLINEETEEDLQGMIVKISDPEPDENTSEEELIKSIAYICEEGDTQCTSDKFIDFTPTSTGTYNITVKVKIKNTRTGIYSTVTGTTIGNFTRLKLKSARNIWGLGSACIDRFVWEFGGTSNPADVKAVQRSVMRWIIEDGWKGRGRWRSFGSMPEGRSFFAYTTYQNKVYVMGGVGPNGPTKTLYIFDPTVGTTGEWSQGAQLLSERYGSCAVSVGNYIYLIGGFDKNGKTLSSVERYNPSENIWEAAPPLSIPRGSLSCAAIGRTIYAIGGVTVAGGTSSVVSTVERLNLDLPSPKWERAPSLNIERAGMSSVAINNKIYVFGGIRENLQPTGKIEVFSAGKWVEYDRTLTEPSYNLTVSPGSGNRVYIISGTKDGRNGLSTFEEWLLE